VVDTGYSNIAMTLKNGIYGLLCLLLLVLFSACAPKGNTVSEYGFFSGIWHGICFPFALIGKLLGFKIGIYAEHNSGFFYWLGYIFGLGGLGGGASQR